MHEAAPVALNAPGRQATQEERAGVGWYRPAAQSVQLLAPDSPEYLPWAQLAHEAAAPSALNLPAAQSVQAAAPAAPE